jgi:hypothetical protein
VPLVERVPPVRGGVAHAVDPSASPPTVATTTTSTATSSAGAGSRHEIHEAFLAIGCCLVCFRRLSHSL